MLGVKEGFDRAWDRRYSHHTQAEHEAESDFSSFWQLKLPDYGQGQQDDGEVNRGIDEAYSHGEFDE